MVERMDTRAMNRGRRVTSRDLGLLTCAADRKGGGRFNLRVLGRQPRCRYGFVTD